MTTVVCMMAIHRRVPITRETIRMLQKQTVPLEIVLVGDSKVERKVADETGCHYVHHRNQPLGAKHQAGVAFAREFDPDALMTTGSDTWITPNWVEEALPNLAHHHAVGKSQWYAMYLGRNRLEVISRQYLPHRVHEPVGVGRIISREGLERCGWELYPKRRQRGLDAGVRLRLGSAGCDVGILNNLKHIMTLGVKGPWETITPWWRVKTPRGLEMLPDIDDPERWLRKHFPGSLEAVERLREAMWHAPRPESEEALPKRAAMVKLHYIGGKTARFHVWGEETGTRYTFGPGNNFTAYVYEDDADALLAFKRRIGRKGMVRQFEEA